MSHVHIVILACNVVSVLPDNRMHLAAQRRYIIRSGLKTRKAVYHVHWVLASRHSTSRRKLQNHNLRTHLRWVAKQIRKSARKSQKVVKFHAYIQILALNLCRLAYEFELDQSQRKSTQVVASPRKWSQVRASGKLALTCESVWPGPYTKLTVLPARFLSHPLPLAFDIQRVGLVQARHTPLCFRLFVGEFLVALWISCLIFPVMRFSVICL